MFKHWNFCRYVRFYFVLVPYNCLELTSGGFFWCILWCMCNVQNLVEKTREYERKGYIDPTKNMKNSKVFIFHGTEDSVIRAGKFLCCN